MNNDQQTVGWMVLLLIGLTLWLVYKPWLDTILFQSPNDPGKDFYTTGPGMVIHPFISAADAIGGTVQAVNPTAPQNQIANPQNDVGPGRFISNLLQGKNPFSK